MRPLDYATARHGPWPLDNATASKTQLLPRQRHRLPATQDVSSGDLMRQSSLVDGHYRMSLPPLLDLNLASSLLSHRYSSIIHCIPHRQGAFLARLLKTQAADTGLHKIFCACASPRAQVPATATALTSDKWQVDVGNCFTQDTDTGLGLDLDGRSPAQKAGTRAIDRRRRRF
jgi:hypothetical protein